jgi:hypothetical protein
VIVTAVAPPVLLEETVAVLEDETAAELDKAVLLLEEDVAIELEEVAWLDEETTAELEEIGAWLEDDAVLELEEVVWLDEEMTAELEEIGAWLEDDVVLELEETVWLDEDRDGLSELLDVVVAGLDDDISAELELSSSVPVAELELPHEASMAMMAMVIQNVNGGSLFAVVIEVPHGFASVNLQLICRSA